MLLRCVVSSMMLWEVEALTYTEFCEQEVLGHAVSGLSLVDEGGRQELDDVRVTSELLLRLAKDLIQQ